MRYSWHHLVSWPILSGVLGLVLLAAVALKGHELATTELLENGLLSSRWFLVLVAEWEIFFALWLLGGFYRGCPQATHWVALLYFFVLFVVAMDSVLKGRPSCPCFGKAIVPPWIAAAFDLTVLFLLAAGPLPPVSGRKQQHKQLFGLAGIFAVFGLLGLVTMIDYSTSGVVPSLRKDVRLFTGVMSVQRVRPTTEEFLDLLRSAPSLNLTVDERLLNYQPDYGAWDLKKIQPWTVMELLAAQQTLPARWEKADEGYVMVSAARFGKSQLFWFGGVIFLALSTIGMRWRQVVEERKKASSGHSDRKRTRVADLHAAKCR